MALIILGLALWWGAHLFKRVMPGARGAMEETMGAASKGVIALALVVSIVLMVLGYRGAAFTPLYTPPGWTLHLNNLLMLVAVILFGMGSSKGRARSWFRHPMLMGFATWAIAHLLVNGDVASVVLFGGLLLWVPVTMVLINSGDPFWERPAPGQPAGDLRLIIISVVVFAVIGAVHGWLGPWPFPGGGS